MGRLFPDRDVGQPTGFASLRAANGDEAYSRHVLTPAARRGNVCNSR
jgi:hypothetical protein